MLNIFMKVSMHAIACGIMVAFITLMGFRQDIEFGAYISVAFLLAGIVCTARMIDSDHTPKEIYGGLLLGILTVLVGIYLG
jgi:uncharacterized membrane protein YjjP (DUF1212 family)